MTKRYFSFLERRSHFERTLLHLLLIVFIGSALFVVASISQRSTVTIPTHGGTMTEGIVGTPRFVNPVLAITRADKDVAALTYSGLMKLNVDGELVPDLAESVTISEDGRVYTITLRQNRYFHDGTPVTAKDVAFTITLIQTPNLKSPLQGNWSGVLVEERGEYELSFTLEEAYTPFIENLTVGILPHHLWNELPIEQLPFSQYNTEPVGSGPYQIETVHLDRSGLVQGYDFVATTNADPRPNIERVEVVFFDTEGALLDALQEGDIDSTPSLSPLAVQSLDESEFSVFHIALPRTFGLFYNQNQSRVLRDSGVRAALSATIDRDELVAQALNGAGIPTDTPIPAGFATLQSLSTSTTSTSATSTNPAELMTKSGWTRNEAGIWETTIDENTIPLRFTISTANNPVFDATATYLAEQFATFGAEVSVDQYTQNDLVQAVIRPRTFEVLLFGNDLTRSLDLYPFWHSSQQNDPGLNVTQYANIETDERLETLRTTQNEAERTVALTEFIDIVNEEQPATFLFTPTFAYVTSPDLVTTQSARLGSPDQRFATIAEWYIEQESVWPVFTNWLQR